MKGYETVYTPSADSKGALKNHGCRPKETVDWLHEIKQPHGTIICCDKCGQHWYVYIWKSDNLYTSTWYKVRWYNFKKRRRILGIE